MNSEQLFTLALGLKSPWKICELEFKESDGDNELHIELGFDRGTKFTDESGSECSVHDRVPRVWRHLNFFEHKTYIHCKVPRIKTTSGKVKQVELPWARELSGFTLLFEAYAMALIENEMPVNKVGRILKEDPHRIWTIFNYWIAKAYSQDKIDKLTKLGLDETSKRKGHNYMTVAVDLDERRVINIADGKDSKSVEDIKEYLEIKGITADQVKHTSIDLSAAFISAITKHFPTASINFDKFHVSQLLNKAMDEVRKKERKEHAELKGHKYTFLKNNKNLTTNKKLELAELITLFPTLGEAYRLKELFRDLWTMKTRDGAEDFINDWCNQVEQANIPAFKDFTKTLRSHQTGILNAIENQINNGILESINCKIQLAKRRAKGYRNLDNFKNMIYFLCSKLKFDFEAIPQGSS